MVDVRYYWTRANSQIPGFIRAWQVDRSGPSSAQIISKENKGKPLQVSSIEGDPMTLVSTRSSSKRLKEAEKMIRSMLRVELKSPTGLPAGRCLNKSQAVYLFTRRIMTFALLFSSCRRYSKLYGPFPIYSRIIRWTGLMLSSTWRSGKQKGKGEIFFLNSCTPRP